MNFHFVKIAFLLLIASCVASGHELTKQEIDPGVQKLGPGFISNLAKVNGTDLHYVRGGTGPAMILVHGFPQDWYEFHKIMPTLSKKFTVVAVDLRGVNRSAPTRAGYDAPNMAKDIHELVQQLKLKSIYIVGHDVGGSVAYAFMRLYPQETRGVMMVEAPLPGFREADEVNAKLWHVGFQQFPNVPEKLIAGKQSVYFREAFFNTGTMNINVISDSELERYVNSYRSPDNLRAGLEIYRAFPVNAKFNGEHRNAIDVPLVLVGGDKAFGDLMPGLATEFKSRGCKNVTTEIIKNSKHYLFDEQPEIMTELIERAMPHNRISRIT